MLSDEGQEMVAKAYLMPARSDVAANRPLISDLKILKINPEAVYGKRNETLKEFNAIFGAKK